MSGIGEIEARHNVMMCPVCGEAITANVTIRPKLGAAKISDDGTSVDLPVDAEMTRFNLNHHCRGRVYAKSAKGEA